MNILKGIVNYVIWWLTAIIGAIILALFAVLYMVVIICYFIGEIFCFIIVAPMDSMDFVIWDPIEDEHPAWAKNIFKNVTKYMCIKPFIKK